MSPAAASQEDQTLSMPSDTTTRVGANTQFDYEGIPAGYYDRVMREGNPIRRLWHVSKFERVLDYLPQPSDPHAESSILDIGCFAGTFLSLVPQDRFSRQLGVDILPAQIAYANRTYGTPFRSFRHVPSITHLRDIEGRSALLLGIAKDNNASCAIGPFIRLFDSTFTLDDVRQAKVELEVTGPDQFRLRGQSDLSKISRDPTDLVRQAMGGVHQYPDGMALMTGTLFAPTEPRKPGGTGFTHMVGDLVSIRSPKLGTLTNKVNHCDKIPPWTFGTTALMRNLAARGLLR